jgi:pimeloyl-ACP methyl ester carboxylesterase
MAFADNKGARIFWEERGSGSPVVLVMGHTYSSVMWYPVVDELAKHHRVITLDNRGTGQSSLMRRISVEDMARDVFAVMDSAGVESAHLYGASMGGGIILEMARQHPDRVRSLLLGCTRAKTPGSDPTPWPLLLLTYLPSPVIARVLKQARRPDAPHGYGSAAPADKIAHDRSVLAAMGTPVRTSAVQTRAIHRYTITEAEVRAITAPTLVLHGDEDEAVPYSEGVRLHELIAGSELLTMTGAGHNYFVAAAAEANAKVLDFLGAVDATQTTAVR